MKLKLENLTDSIEKLHTHNHICLIYGNQREWSAGIVTFMKSGLRKGEKCVYIHHAHTADQIRKCLLEGEVDVAAAESSKKLEIVHSSKIYTKEVLFDPAKVISLFVNKTKRAVTKGYRGLRVAGEMSWAVDEQSGMEKLLEYEEKLNEKVFKKYPCIGVCQYDREKFGSEILKDLVLAHPLLIINNSMYQNFHFIPPEKNLKEERSEHEFQQLLSSIKQYHNSHENLRFLTEMLNNSPHPLISYSPDGRMIACNTAFCVLTGYSEKELYDMNLFQGLTSPEWRDSEAKELNKLSRDGKIQYFKKEIICRDGHSLPIELFIKGVYDAKGRVEYYFSFVTNIIEILKKKVASYAKEQLGEKKSRKKKPVEELIEDLNNKSKEIRANAAWTLGDMKEKKAVEALIHCLKDRSTDVRWTSAWALGQIKDNKAIDPLHLALNDRDVDVRHIAREASEKIETKKKDR